MRFLAVIGTFLIAVLFFSSCEKSSNASPIPSISFKSFESTGANSGNLQINFTDGDGDIGYPPQNTNAPPNLWVKFLYYNYSLKQFVGVWDPNDSSTFDSVYFIYAVPYITPQGKDKSLTGIIQVAMNDWYANPFSTQDSLQYLQVQFKIWLIDRAGNKSNVITTPTLYPGKNTP